MKIYDLSSDGDIHGEDLPTCPLCDQPIFVGDPAIAHFEGSFCLIHDDCGHELGYSFQEVEA